MKIFLCGDVMTGRGIDQILPHPSDPVLYESYVKNAGLYVRLAEDINGTIRKPVAYNYIWGDALSILHEESPDVRIINLETAITSSSDLWEGKAVNYRMNPANIECLRSAKIDFCSLSNNHVLDWGYSGLAETLKTLAGEKISYAGAGLNSIDAAKPAVITTGRGRVIVYSMGFESSGIPEEWKAEKKRPGVNLLPDLKKRTAAIIIDEIKKIKTDGDVVVVSIHWGGNWGYDVSADERNFAAELAGSGAADIIHGHSSHHAKGFEIINNRLVLYGCGDFINDYEGIGGHEFFRGDLAVMYFAETDQLSGNLARLEMVPMIMKRLQLKRASREDALHLTGMFNMEGVKYGTSVDLCDDNRIVLKMS